MLFSDRNDQFVVRASGGVKLYTNPAATMGVRLAPGSGAWSAVSDRNAKANSTSVDVRTILESVAAMPIQTWNYKTQDSSIRHIGPMAQDFAAAFDVGEDDMHISTIDADGVALAAIQGLCQIMQKKDVQIVTQQDRITSLEQQVAAQRQQYATLEKRLTAVEMTLREGREPNHSLESTLPDSWLILGWLLFAGLLLRSHFRSRSKGRL